jgi:hypothetical protein
MDETDDDWQVRPGPSRRRSRLARIGRPAALVAAGLITGGVLAGTLSAGASTLSGGGTPSRTEAGRYGGPALQGSDGAPEAQGRHARALALTGTVTAVGGDTVTIKTSTGATTTYKVDSSTDIDKNGEAKLSDLAVGDAVRYSVRSGTTTIDILHAGDESKDMPAAPPGAGGGSAGGSSGGTAGSPGPST